MIDPENQVYTACREALLEEEPWANITGEYVRKPASFPHVSVVMMNSSAASLDSADNEAMANVMFEVNVYSNKESGKKTEAKKLMDVIDRVMYSMNLNRTSCIPVPNLEDATIYRMVARFYGKTDGNYLYRR